VAYKFACLFVFAKKKGAHEANASFAKKKDTHWAKYSPDGSADCEMQENTCLEGH
jgi:hypothetical protein